MAPSKLNMRIKGILKANNNANDKTTSFCS